jgi:hypothetical protein
MQMTLASYNQSQWLWFLDNMVHLEGIEPTILEAKKLFCGLEMFVLPMRGLYLPENPKVVEWFHTLVQNCLGDEEENERIHRGRLSL